MRQDREARNAERQRKSEAARAARINSLLDRSGNSAGGVDAHCPEATVNVHGVRMRDVLPGEFWWADFPFEQEPGQSKRRPCLVLRRNLDGTVEVCYVTSQNHVFARHGTYQLLPRTVTGLGKESYVRLDKSFALEADRFLQYDALCERPLFEWVVAQIKERVVSTGGPAQRSSAPPTDADEHRHRPGMPVDYPALARAIQRAKTEDWPRILEDAGVDPETLRLELDRVAAAGGFEPAAHARGGGIADPVTGVEILAERLWFLRWQRHQMMTLNVHRTDANEITRADGLGGGGHSGLGASHTVAPTRPAPLDVPRPTAPSALQMAALIRTVPSAMTEIRGAAEAELERTAGRRAALQRVLHHKRAALDILMSMFPEYGATGYVMPGVNKVWGELIDELSSGN